MTYKIVIIDFFDGQRSFSTRFRHLSHPAAEIAAAYEIERLSDRPFSASLLVTIQPERLYALAQRLRRR